MPRPIPRPNLKKKEEGHPEWNVRKTAKSKLAQLKWFARNPAKSKMAQRHAKIVISAANRYFDSYAKIAATHHCSERSVGEWCRRYVREGIACLDGKAGRGRKFTAAKKVLAIIPLLPETNPKPIEHLLAERLPGVGIRAIRRFLRKDRIADMRVSIFETRRQNYRRKLAQTES